ncbi:daptomycin-sensing surface protein LiaX [Isobaculum melis]|uniref:Putative adhesin n=1 Tax=Isobaculum melis TaxID=142588 RepID=A0A1H9QKZ6_9LACT|nr:daptomycin-sensing surface protein LiaX [Isobaculum melis]SER61142.1 Putative adhesin [Isobaculum melis]
MKERERILELVRQGVISTEEALVLLESAAANQGVKATQVEQENIKRPVVTPESEQVVEPVTPEVDRDQDFNQAYKEAEAADKKRLEALLEELANEASKYSAQLDVTNEEIADLRGQLAVQKEKLSMLETMEELETLSEDKEAQIETVEDIIEDLEDQIDVLEEEREEIIEKLQEIKEQQEESKEDKKGFSDIFDLPEDWKETASDTLNQVGEKVTEAGSQFGKFMKETFHSVMENVDWKEVNIRVPGLASTKFDHVFTYPNSEASILDIKVANGDVVFKNWDSSDIKIEAKIKIYGKSDITNPFEAFLERSTIDENDDTLTFHVPNKRLRADLVFYLPKRSYDHTAIKLLNGNIQFDSFEGKDIYAKSTNGNMLFNTTTATMIEAEGVNGNITVTDSDIRDLLAKSINGTLTVSSKLKSGNLSTVNGTVKVTLKAEDAKKIDANSVNGSVKISVPKHLSLEGDAKTNLGNIQSRLSEMEVLKEKTDRTNKKLLFRRAGETEALHLVLSTTTGNILLKDQTDK